MRNYAAGNKFIRYESMAKHLTEWRADPETGWLSEAPYHTLQQSLRDLDRGYQNFFAKRSDHPTFKKKGIGDSFRYPDPKQIKLDASNSRIFLPKLGWVRYRNSREVKGTVRNVTVSQSGGKWFISIQTAREVEQPVHPSKTAVAVDMGVVRFGTMSDGTVLTALNIFRRLETTLCKAQQAMSRKKKFSNNWKKAKAKVQRIHLRIANARRDFLHKASTAISKSHAMVVVEDLQVNNMSRSAKGTVEKPGRNVRAKSGLNKAILDQGWSEFRRQLEYKLLWDGGLLLAVPPMNTSRTCLCCGNISKDNRKTQSVFRCVACGFTKNADLAAAINILRAGYARIACQVNGEVMPSAAGTILRRSAGLTPALPQGIPFLSAQAAA
jgi:putative transposase